MSAANFRTSGCRLLVKVPGSGSSPGRIVDSHFHEPRSEAGAGLTKVSREAWHVPYVCLELIRIMSVEGFPQLFEDMGLEILPLVY